MNRSETNGGYVSRGGPKLHHALETFALRVGGLDCADLGCSTGGFTDCLLRAGARSVVSVDTGYGVIAYRLRTDPRVRVVERSNALHTPPAPGGVDLVVIDLGWTPQRLCIPAALAWLRPGGRIVTLVKPHYEDKALATEHRGILPDQAACAVAEHVVAGFPALGARLLGLTLSPVRGSGGKKPGDGNQEWLALCEPLAEAHDGPASERLQL
ncbi:MAG: SAM-dependent methyltransferase [Phycisphaerales bacterium]